MTVQYVEYSLANGYIQHWLLGGPVQQPVSMPSSAAAADRKHQIVVEMEDPTPGYSEAPMDWTSFSYKGSMVDWRYYRCGIDHLVDVSAFFPTWQHVRTWAFTRLVLPSKAVLQFALSVQGPAQVWLNGTRVFEVADFQDGLTPVTFSVEAEKENDLLVRFDQIGVRDCLNQMSLQLVKIPDGMTQEEIQVNIPTQANYPRRQKMFEEMFDKAYLGEVANYRGSRVDLRFAEDTKDEMRYAYQIQDAQERIYVEGTWNADTGEPLDIGHPQRIFERQMWVVLRPTGREYFEQNLRVERRMPLYILDNWYSNAPYGDPASRRKEALEDAARREGNLYGEIAKMALEKWDKVDVQTIQDSIARVSRREAGSAEQAAGLLSMLYRFSDQAGFPQGLGESLDGSIQGYQYGPVDGVDSGMDFTSESQSILLNTCEILAGQRYPDTLFATSGLKGCDHQANGEKQAVLWLQQRAVNGFAEWDSNSAYETDIMALSLLTSLAQSEMIRELSAVLLDKLLFLIAVNTFKGAYGSTHGRSTSQMIKSAQLEATSGITRLLWGMGVFSQYIQGVVSLACSDYEYPSFFADIAAQLPPEMWSKEHHQTGSVDVNKVVYKTPDYMLSSAQDYRPGQPGKGEHIWQATLAPDAVVFVNHPACESEGPGHQNDFWLGNAVLPRVAQWKDVLMAAYQLPEDDRMGFTHAFFPTLMFDEYELTGGWAFARKGSGFVALTAMQGIELAKRGPEGYRELRSYGQKNLWICHMGREVKDDSYHNFKRRIQRMKLDWQEQSVALTSLRGVKLAFGWEGPLMVNGQEQAISGFKHIDNPYCTAELPADQMDIRYGELMLRLKFQ